MQQHTPPPLVLVKTWLELLTNADEQEARKHASRMLINAFGSVEVAVIYIEQKGNPH